MFPIKNYTTMFNGIHDPIIPLQVPWNNEMRHTHGKGVYQFMKTLFLWFFLLFVMTGFLVIFSLGFYRIE
ncbi:hypothetical protein SNEBB_004362 [Seison nebaliae]|nr:hypothetical protein SNEBB_004362 [Seison nebaliae]